MQSENRFLADLAKMMNGAAGTMAGVGREAADGARERTREWLAGMDFVSREEFDAVKQMAATAREDSEKLAERVAALEALLAKATPAKKPAARRAAKKAE